MLRNARWLTFGLFVLGFCRAFGALVETSPFASVIAATPATASSDRTVGNRVAVLSNGYDALLLRVHLIRAATRSIDIQTFIWTNDEVGRLRCGN